MHIFLNEGIEVVEFSLSVALSIIFLIVCFMFSVIIFNYFLNFFHIVLCLIFQ